MMRKEHPGWTSRDIRELFDSIVDELSLITECQPSERMIEIDHNTASVTSITDRIMDRYTIAHIRHYSESTNDDFAEDLRDDSLIGIYSEWEGEK